MLSAEIVRSFECWTATALAATTKTAHASAGATGPRWTPSAAVDLTLLGGCLRRLEALAEVEEQQCSIRMTGDAVQYNENEYSIQMNENSILEMELIHQIHQGPPPVSLSL